jgi:dTDP-4-amino-4,6-dideoxygalactose transaminase
MVGSIGDLTCFSFYATKTITTGEGGMITTNDDAAIKRLRLLALHGISNDAWRRADNADPWRYEIVEAGFKANMSDLNAALGRSQLRRARSMQQRRLEIAMAYNAAFGGREDVELPYCPPDVEHSWHLYTLRIVPELFDVDRGQLIRELKARNIGTSVHFIPLHHHRYYQQTFGYTPEQLPVATYEFSREISLPIYTRMTDADVADVIEAVSATLDEHRGVPVRAGHDRR